MITIAIFCIVQYLSREKEELLRFLLWSLIMQFILSNLFALKYGSGLNYFTEWIILLFLGVAYYSERINSALGIIYSKLGLIVLSLGLIYKTFNILPNLIWVSQKQAYALSINLYSTEKKVSEYLIKQNRSRKFYVFNNFDNFRSYLNSFLIDQSLCPQMDIIKLASAYSKKSFDYTDFKRKIDNGEVQFVIVNPANVPLKFYDLNFDHYKLDTIIENYAIYRSN
jgi:hypothetical protein